MHLLAAERIRDHPYLGTNVRNLLYRYYPAFYFGNVAPDYQWLCDIPRETTHFYTLPLTDNWDATQAMFANYPELLEAAALPREQAVFVAGYCTHLLLDLRWYRDILIPFFVETAGWQDHFQRFVAHHTLLTYLDSQAVSLLPDDARAILAAAEPHHWLPFADNIDLLRWQSMLVAQLEPSAPLQTAVIYADRLSISADEYMARLAEPEWMDENLFNRVAVGEVEDILVNSVSESALFVNTYLGGNILA